MANDETGETRNVKKLLDKAGAKHAKDAQDFTQELQMFNNSVLDDHRWDNARAFLEERRKLTEDSAYIVLREGAKSFGMWPLSESALKGLARQLLHEQRDSVSEAFGAWVKAEKEEEKQKAANEIDNQQRDTEASRRVAAFKQTSEKAVINDAALTEHRKPKGDYLGFAHPKHIMALCIAIIVVIFIMSNLYALDVVLNKYKGVTDVFGWPVYVARAGGLGSLLWTALIYLTMSKTFMRYMLKYASCGWRLSWVLDAHKEIHIFCGYGVLVTGLVHSLAHAVGTAPGIVRFTTDEEHRKKINDIIGCANADTTPGYLGVRMKWLEWPSCPVDEQLNYLDVLFRSTIGLTGVLLVVVILITYKTAKHRSDGPGRFEIFWYVHNIAIFSWPVLLFLHGSNGWLGIGFPLVVFACGLPIALYSIDRILRMIRYYLFTGKHVKIVDVTLRPGNGGGPDGALTMLNVSKPPYLWSFTSGMYAFVCMPEYAPLEWHPFTICSGDYDETVDFLIAEVGDWSRALAAHCLAAHDGTKNLPKLAIDGPYAAPTQSALSRELLIAVGAGVGVTPLLSLLSTLVASLEDHKHKAAFALKEAHFFWMTRSADEFLFGQDVITKIYTHPELRQRIHIHLHITSKELPNDAPAYIFRESVRRQSIVDRKLFSSQFKTGHRPGALVDGAPLPWCWVHGTKQDVIWVNKLVREKGVDEHLHDLLPTHLPSWAHQKFAKPHPMAATVDGEGKVTRMHTSMLADKAGAGEVKGHDPKLMVPVVFGRPDFAAEIYSIANALPNTNAHVYVCGNDTIVKHLQEVCRACNSDAKAHQRTQRLELHYERFG